MMLLSLLIISVALNCVLGYYIYTRRINMDEAVEYVRDLVQSPDVAALGRRDIYQLPPAGRVVRVIEKPTYSPDRKEGGQVVKVAPKQIRDVVLGKRPELPSE
jgi:hypothetical protein